MKIVFLLVFLLSFNVKSQQIETKEFWLCSQERATGVQVRSLRIHRFPENNKCLSLYARSGEDSVIAKGKWFGFCQKMVNQVKENLQNHFWDCKKFPSALFFYSEKQKSVL